MRALLLVGVGLAAAMAAPRGAHACGAMPETSFAEIAPQDGATEVPTNTWLWLTYRGFDYSGTSDAAEVDVVLQVAGGDPVVVTVIREGESEQRLVIVQPDAELLPQTTYEVKGRVQPNCGVNCVSSTYLTYATFTTGTDSLTTAPDFAGLSGIDTRPDVCTSDSCCGPYRAVRVQLSWPWLVDQDVAIYRVYRDGTFVNAGNLYSGALDCGSFPYGAFGAFQATTGSYTVHAVNLAGMEDTNTASVELSVDCNGVRDAGVDGLRGQHDASTDGTGAQGGGTGDGGCTVGTTAAGVSPVLVALVVVAAGRRPRWRRR